LEHDGDALLLHFCEVAIFVNIFVLDDFFSYQLGVVFIGLADFVEFVARCKDWDFVKSLVPDRILFFFDKLSYQLSSLVTNEHRDGRSVYVFRDTIQRVCDKHGEVVVIQL